jgi:hypothetical protein
VTLAKNEVLHLHCHLQPHSPAACQWCHDDTVAQAEISQFDRREEGLGLTDDISWDDPSHRSHFTAPVKL